MSAAALALTAVVLAVVIMLTGAELSTIGSFAALVVLGWLIADFAARRLVRPHDAEAKVPAESPDAAVAAVTEAAVAESPDGAVAAATETAVATAPAEPSPRVVREAHSPLSEAPHPPPAMAGDSTAMRAPIDAVALEDAAPGYRSQPEPTIPPTEIEPREVVRLLLERADELGTPVSAGLWLEDSPTASLRLIAGAGDIPPEGAPLSTETGIVADALTEMQTVITPLADVTRNGIKRRLWRVVLPLAVGDSRGAAILDVHPGGELTLSRAADVLAPLSGALAGAVALHVARLETAVARELVSAARELSRCVNPDIVLTTALGRAMTLSEAETGSIMLLGEDEMLTIVRSEGIPRETVSTTRVARGEGIAGWVLASGKPLLIEDLPSDRDRSKRLVCSAVSVPIADEDGTLGVLNVGSRAFPARFTQGHLDAMEVLGRQTCVAYRNALAVDSVRDLYLSTMRTLALAMETKDPYSRGATDRVLDLVLALCREFELDDETTASVELAGLFHDMGMGAIGASISSESRPLTTVERGLLKMHPVIGAEILEQAPALRNVAPIVYHHHERFDGKGYVGEVAGESIPLGARILSVVDAYVAMTSPRPYRDPLMPNEAIAELEENAGTQFDPKVVATFVRLLGEEGVRNRDRTE